MAIEAFKDEKVGPLRLFEARIEKAKTREDLVRAWVSVPAFAARPDYLQERIFARFEPLEGRFIVAGIQAALKQRTPAPKR